MVLRKVIILMIVFGLLSITNQMDNGQAKTPPMGWNSWNYFGCNINEKLIKQTADKIVQLGLDKKGYSYVNLDDCWQKARNQTTGQIIQDLQQFPNGIAALSAYVHNKGLKFGLYSDAGNKTCEGRPGGYGYERIDALTYAKWEIDYLKYDNCNHPNVSAKFRYYAMYKALNDSGRHILYSICNWGQERVWEWGNVMANAWRTTGDIQDKWASFIKNLDLQVGLQKYSQIGGWNDPDMLQTGNGGMTFNEYYAQFALWCLLKAPLLIGCNFDKITNQTIQIIGNQELIAINQDSLGIQGRRIKSQIGSSIKKQVWGGILYGNRYAIVFFNRGQTQTDIQISLKNEIGLIFSSYTQRDPIRHSNIGVSNRDIITVGVSPHSVQVRILTWIPIQNLVSDE